MIIEVCFGSEQEHAVDVIVAHEFGSSQIGRHLHKLCVVCALSSVSNLGEPVGFQVPP